MADKICKDCGSSLEYQGDLGSPGVGQSWMCVGCGESYWVHFGTAIKFAELEPDDVTTSEWG